MSTTTIIHEADVVELQETPHVHQGVDYRSYSTLAQGNSIQAALPHKTLLAAHFPPSKNTPSLHEQLTARDAPPRTQFIRAARANLIILQLSTLTFLTSLTTGIVVVGLPRIAADLDLPQKLYLWPTSVYGLTAGSTLLLGGAIADVVGARSVDLTGCTLLGVFTLGLGLSQTGIQLVIFRALQGVGSAMHMPSSVSLVTQYVPSGKRRNIGFATLGLSMPLGFSVGLVLGGVLVDTVGWRIGFYVTGGVMLALAGCGLKLVPADARQQNVIKKLRTEIDWIGAGIACGSLALFSYVLAILSADSNNITHVSTIIMLIVSVLLMLAFPVWMRFQEKRGQPALIPNSLWTNVPFSSICALMILIWGVVDGLELFSSLYFQEVQEFSALQASVRILPSLVVGVILNLTTGYLVDRTSVFWLVFISTVLSGGAPLLMALIDPSWTYWKGAFFAQILSPLSSDVLSTVGLIVVSEALPERTAALAGGIFNTFAYFGLSLVLNLLQVVSTLVTEGTQYRDKSAPSALLRGYRASFWAMFAAVIGSCVICVFGLRKIGKVGLKRE